MTPVPKKILICDDNAHLALIIKHLLVRRGYSVLTAENGNEGLKLVRSNQPDLLLLDLHMTEKDGFAVLQALKDSKIKPPYTIVVSAQQGSEKREQASALGAQEVWKKPFNAAELLKRIEALVENGTI